MQHTHGPHWLGIGAQRGGTTWISDLMLQHPKVGVPDGIKELHKLYLGLIDGWSDELSKQYRDLFRGEDGVRLGEWTPYYMRAPWVIDVVRREVGEDVPILVLLRDPVARFESAVRLSVKRVRRQPKKPPRHWIRNTASESIWSGFYDLQLSRWIDALGRDRFRVMQYEQVVKQPQETVNAIWAALGLDPIKLTDIDRPSPVSTDPSLWRMDDDLRTHLTATYAEDARRTVERFDFDPALWPTIR